MNIIKWFAMLAVMLALTGFVMAETNDTNNSSDINDNVTQAQALSIRYDNMQCKVAFTDTQVDLLNQYISVDQTANKDILLTDMTTLKTYVDSTDRAGFDAYLENTVRQDLQNASKNLTNAKKNFRQYNVSNESRTAFINGLNNAKDVYSNCVNDKEIKMANVMETHMRNWNRQWSNVINKMSEKNITMDDAKALQAEIDAKNEELKALIASGNITQIRDFMQTYHQDQLHYAARFEISRLKGYVGKLAPLADKYNMTGKLDDINTKIADAEKYAQTGHKYAEGEFNNTWSDIKNAGKEMQQAAKDINSERAKIRQQRASDRQQRNLSGHGPKNKIENLNNDGNNNVSGEAQ
jgi:hypothetical protein